VREVNPRSSNPCANRSGWQGGEARRGGQDTCRLQSRYNLQAERIRWKSCTPAKCPAMAEPLQIHTIVSLPFEENTYIIWLPSRRDCLVIDPGLEPESILVFLDEHGLEPAAILNTHGHADHIGGNEALKQRYPRAPLVIGRHDAMRRKALDRERARNPHP